MAKTLRYAWNYWDDNVLKGSASNPDEEFRGGDGNDQIFAEGGDDLVLGQNGNDTLTGGYGSDEVLGGADDDVLSGGDGSSLDGFDIIDGGSGNDTLHFSGADQYIGGTGTDTFDGSQLEYIVRFVGDVEIASLGPRASHGLRMDLEAGIATFRGDGSAAPENFYSDGAFIGQTMGTSTASFSSIEIYDLTNFGDYFEGDNTSDVIKGRGGDDVIEGKGGADAIDGGNDNDTIEFGSSLELVNVDLERGTGIGGDAQGDTYVSIENIRGSANGDALFGNDAANILMGRGGDDILEGRGGADVIDGGTGIDLASYASAARGVSVNLTAAQQDPNDAFSDSHGDVLISIENVEGSEFLDSLIGDANANTLNGRGSADTIDGGFGNDILIGGSGRDTVSFLSHDPAGFQIAPTVNIDLTLGTATHTSLIFNLGRVVGTTTETDTLSSFENVRGSNNAETIRGDDQQNILEGRGGNDTLRGEGGIDELNGGAGFDKLFGGSGSDFFKYEAVSDAQPFTPAGILALEQIADFQDSGIEQDEIDLHLLRTANNKQLFFNDGDDQLFEIGELVLNTLADGRSYIAADLTGDGNIDFAISFDRQITTLDASDFHF